MTEAGCDPETGPYLHFVHLLMPSYENQTTYFWAAARNFDVGDEQVSGLMRDAITNAFVTEDKPMIEAIQQRMGATRDIFDLDPVLLAGDKASVLVRRALSKLQSGDAGAGDRPLA